MPVEAIIQGFTELNNRVRFKPDHENVVIKAGQLKSIVNMGILVCEYSQEIERRVETLKGMIEEALETLGGMVESRDEWADIARRAIEQTNQAHDLVKKNQEMVKEAIEKTSPPKPRNRFKEPSGGFPEASDN